MAEVVHISATERKAMTEYSDAYAAFDSLLLEYNQLPWWAFWRKIKLGDPLNAAEARLNRALRTLRTLRGW